MVCTTVIVAAAIGPGDKYYDCVSGKCDEKIGGQYKNDPKCAGKCVPAADDTGTYILLGAVALGLALIFRGKT